MADRVFFIDRNRGNDSNSGLSRSAAWASLSKITSQTDAGPGDFFLLADDSRWDLDYAIGSDGRVVPSTSWTGNRRRPVTIGRYAPSSQSVGNKPTILFHHEIAADEWVYDADLNGWLWTAPSAHVNMMGLLRIADTWIANGIDQAAAVEGSSTGAVASIDGRYNKTSTNNKLLLYAPAGANPTTYYGKVIYSPEATGAITLSSGRKCIVVEDLHFEETGAGVLMYSNNTTEAYYVARGLSGRVVSGLVTMNADTSGALEAVAEDCEISDYGVTGIHANATGGAGFKSVEIRRNKLRNGGHVQSQAGIYVQVRNAAREFICKVWGNDIAGHRWGTRDKGYDGCGIYAETGSDGVLIFGNVVHDQYCAFQDNSGRRNFWFGNVAYNVRIGFRLSDQQLNNQSDCRFHNNTLLVGFNQPMTEWGAAQGQEYPGIWMYKGSSTLNLAASNNIIANVGGQRGRAAFGLPDVYATSTYSLTNNWIYGFEAETLKASDNSAPSPAPTVTKAGSTDPRAFINIDGRLRVPYMLDDIPILNPLGAAGTYVQGVRLMEGQRAQPGRTPIGAFALGRTYADERGTAESLITQDFLNIMSEDGTFLTMEE